MASEHEHFYVAEHVIPASFMRGFTRAVRDETTDRLRLAVKQYTPKPHKTPQIGDPTIIVAQGTGFVKELYEPFLEELVKLQPSVREIWTFDAVVEGSSYAINQHVLGDEYHWFDHSRDILQLMNHFQDVMVPPFVGIGHSRGGSQILMAATYHPRLFNSLVVIEPGSEPGFNTTPAMAAMQKLVATGRDRWPSRAAAAASIRKSPFYASWDPRVIDRQLQYGLSNDYQGDAANDLIAPPGDQPSKLSTPIAMQLHGFFRPDPPLSGHPRGPDYRLRGHASAVPGFYRTEPKAIYDILPNLYPSTLFVWGAASAVCSPRYRKTLSEVTGTGHGGNGGLGEGMVESVEVPRTGHSPQFEQVEPTTKVVADWLGRERERWLAEWRSRQSQPGFSSGPNPEYLARTSKMKL